MSSQAKHILLLPGDGIGPEVVAEAEKIIALFGFSTSRALIGGTAYDAEGTPFPDTTLAAAGAADAILLGAVGGPKWEPLPIGLRPERGLLGLRKELALFANIRPALCFDALADASTLKREIIAGLDIVIVRELTGGIYFGQPRGVTTLPDGTRRGINTEVYTTPEVARIAKVAFELAGKRLIMLSTHIVSDVEAIATDLVVMQKGRLRFAGSPQELLRAAIGASGATWRHH